MNIVVFGANGQLGQSLLATEPSDIQVEYATRTDCDLSEPGSLESYLVQREPDLIINAAAYTAVDLAEEERTLAYRVNCDAVGEMAAWVAANAKARLIHISTDFVFDGTKATPYLPGDPTGPLGVYGASKLAGEERALQAAPERTMIIRTAWLYSEYGANFVKTMLRLFATGNEVNVVSDQHGSPTYARGLAEVVWGIVVDRQFTPGIFHWADKGNTTWYEFACAVQHEAFQADMLSARVPVNAIGTDQYPTPAERPAYSVLDTSKLGDALGIEPALWQDNLKRMLNNMA